MTTFNTLRAAIRHVVDQADRALTQAEIYTLCTWRTTRASFGVTVCNMALARQLRKRKVRKGGGHGMGVRYVYAPGPEPVEDFPAGYAKRPKRIMGFMEYRRQQAARARR